MYRIHLHDEHGHYQTIVSAVDTAEAATTEARSIIGGRLTVYAEISRDRAVVRRVTASAVEDYERIT